MPLPPRGPLRVALLLGVVVAARATHAQPAAPALPSVTLDEALAQAREHEPRIRAALAELKARRAEAQLPRARWMPRVGGVLEVYGATSNNTTTVYQNVGEVDLPRIGATPGTMNSDVSWSPHASTLAALSATQEIYDFGRIAAESAVADAIAAVAQADVETQRLEVQLAVEEAYHGVLAAHEVQGATEDAYKRAVTHRDFAQAGVRSGLRPPIDLTRAQADVAGLEVQRVRAAAGLRSARAALAASMGADQLEIDAQPLPPDASPAPTLDEVMRTAASRNPIIAAATARVDAQHAATRLIGRELAPNLVLSTGLSGRAGGAAPSNGEVPYGAGWLPDVANWHVGLVMGWRVFDGTLLMRRRASLAREEASRAELDLARLSVGLGAQRAYVDLDAALRALPGLATAVAAAKANQAQAEARFKAGLGTIVELADAEALLTRTQLDLAVGQFTVARARGELGRAMGEAAAPQIRKTR